MNMRPRSPFPMVRAALALALTVLAGAALADPPGRVARMSYISGNASFQPGGDDRWSEAMINRPLVTGDRLYTDSDSRVELEVGTAVLRMDDRTSLAFLDVNDDIVQVELTQGTLNLQVKRLFDGQTYEVDTPTLAFVVDRPGNYRIDIAPQGDSTMVTVFEGAGSVYGQGGASYRVDDRQSYRFHDASLRDYEVMDLPRSDNFDRWCFERADRYQRSVARQYVSEEVIGYADLDGYGSWTSHASYGSVWFPTTVAVGWAPYRYGRWSWIDPWGWSWVDDAPWGFAPSHYGRWVYVGNRWGWCPGPRHLRPVYAPALVGFIGGRNWSVSISSGGGPVGWFPLGPRDVYVPWYRSSRTYFTNVNVTNIRNTTVINNTYITNVYNNYAAGRPAGIDYAYRRDVHAVTAVPDNVFNSSGRVGSARLNLDRNSLARAEVVSRVPVLPTQASLAPRGGARDLPQRAASFDRAVIARNAPPPAPAPFEQRKLAIERNGGQPLQTQELRQLADRAPKTAAASRQERIQVVGNGAAQRAPQALPPKSAAPGRIERAPERAAAVGAKAPATDPSRAPATATPDRRAVAPERAPTATQRSERALPSSGYAPRGERAPAAKIERGGTPAATPRTERAPAAAPRVERAPQAARPPVETRKQPTPSERPARTMQPREPAQQRAPAPAGRQYEPRKAEPAVREPAPARSYRQAAPEPRRIEQAPARRVEPQPRAEPAPQRMERSAPQAAPRVAPPPQQKRAPEPRQQAAPPQKQQRVERSRDNDGKGKDDR
ncbi:MAG TPA: DUF6600 domain-containing protein [Dokdonella sp.]|uniref:DUF6600 domain-containing protein n=1 Tax=Dokdonella sp. TaxID=2291710 RepID=UPI002B80AE8C|nr:DUF6600 domain-containing protein [Dokdonella sp.]HUD42235.1 DUF6600 domain-containing protein [Dokdonella sp.]